MFYNEVYKLKIIIRRKTRKRNNAKFFPTASYSYTKYSENYVNFTLLLIIKIFYLISFSVIKHCDTTCYAVDETAYLYQCSRDKSLNSCFLTCVFT